MSSTGAQMRFFAGDENGALKTVTCGLGPEPVVTALPVRSESKSPVQRLSTCKAESGSRLLAFVRAHGEICTSVIDVQTNEVVETLVDAREDRMKSSDQFIGLDVRKNGVYTCTTAGHLRFTPFLGEEAGSSSTSAALGSLPMRLRDLHLSPTGNTLAYGGDEVNLSVWDTERALSSKPIAVSSSADGQVGSKRRKPNSDLLPGERWRAKNDPNDFLSLREPVKITNLAYVDEECLVTGNQNGSVKLYDTRRGRRPVAYWKDVHKGSVKLVEKGQAEHEIFTADATGSLYTLDSRNGRVIYSYKGISGGVTSIAACPAHMASVSLDRFFRLHTAPGAPKTQGQNVSAKGSTVTQAYMKSTPTALVWCDEDVRAAPSAAATGEADEELWEGMAEAEDLSEDDESIDESSGQRKRRRKQEGR